MSMTERATREMTFDEEYEILQKEKNELFSKENDNEEPPFANCVVRRALRCVRKLREEREQYRAIGTVSEFRELKEKATAKVSYGIKCPHCNFYTSNGRYCCNCGKMLVAKSEGKE